MAEVVSIFGEYADHPKALVAAALSVALGGSEVAEMLRDRMAGRSVRTIADLYCIPRTTVARRLEHAEMKVEMIKELANGLMDASVCQSNNDSHKCDTLSKP